jgi:hypothetical protein
MERSGKRKNGMEAHGTIGRGKGILPIVNTATLLSKVFFKFTATNPEC